MQAMTIGKVAKQAGVSTDAIRFYERLRLINKPARTLSNYRVYPRDDVARVKFIKKAKNLGFSLSEIRELLALRHVATASKADVKQRVEEKIDDVRGRIKELKRILTALEQLSYKCDGHGPISDCEILKELEHFED